MSVLVGRKAPEFTAPAVLGNGEYNNTFTLPQDKYTLLFFYPLDFTFVCPTELIELNRAYDEFVKRNVEIVAISIDSHHVHNAWKNATNGIGQVRYTMVGDIDHNICQAYGVEHPEEHIAFRAAFIIDAHGIIRSEIVNDLPVGRNIDELLRLVDAFQFTEEHGEVCPANWKLGDVGMTPTLEGVSAYLGEHYD